MIKEECLFDLAERIFDEQQELGMGIKGNFPRYIEYIIPGSMLTLKLTRKEFNDFIESIDLPYLSNHEIAEMEIESST